MIGKSTITNLTCFSQYMVEVIDENGQVDIVYSDFSKGFDRINYDLLLGKLRRTAVEFVDILPF